MASLITRTAAELECLLLEKLPGEIRNRIYELALPANSAILVSLQSKNLNTCQIKYDADHHITFKPRQPALTRASRQLREETLKLYYSSNTFVFSENMLVPGATAMFKAQRSAGLRFLKQVKVNQKISLKWRYKDRHEDGWYQNCTSGITIRFTACVTEDGRMLIRDLQRSRTNSAVETTHNYGLPCCCFLETPSQLASDEYGLVDLLIDYSERVNGVERYSKGLCERYGGVQFQPLGYMAEDDTKGTWVGGSWWHEMQQQMWG